MTFKFSQKFMHSIWQQEETPIRLLLKKLGLVAPKICNSSCQLQQNEYYEYLLKTGCGFVFGFTVYRQTKLYRISKTANIAI